MNIELPPLRRFSQDFHRARAMPNGPWCFYDEVEARERILLARIAELADELAAAKATIDAAAEQHTRREASIAELEGALADCVDLAEWWINHKREPGMCERDYRTWLALGHHSEGLLRAKAAIDAARKA